MPTWPSPVLSSGFTYVSSTAPTAPEEGETWYDTSANEAKVYDGVSWLKLTVTDHAELGNVSAGQHRSDANIQSVVDGEVDADTVDGKHASDFGGSVSFRHFNWGTDGASGSVTPSSGTGWYVFYVDVNGDTGNYTSSVTLHYNDGTSDGYASSNDDGPVHLPHRRGSHVTQIDYSVGDQYSGINLAVMEVPL